MFEIVTFLTMDAKDSMTPSGHPFFNESSKEIAILLIDASGSTRSEFKDKQPVFMKMYEIISQLKHPGYRVLFWNSPNSSEKFASGTLSFPFVVKNENLRTAFDIVFRDIKDTCFTFTNLAFANIPKEWLVNNPVIYLVTDGEITQDQNNLIRKLLGDEINKLEARLCIITVEIKKIDYSKTETMDNAAGGDVFKVIQDRKLTNKVTQFISYTLPADINKDSHDSFIHINRNNPPPGFIPYQQKYFSELRTGEFIQFIANELKEAKDDSKQLQIAQDLSTTLHRLTTDKPLNIKNEIIKMFASLFTIDANMIKFILSEAIEREKQGTAGVFAAYRKQLKNLYEESDRMLKENVKDAIGLGDLFYSFPINNRILVGPSRMINKPIQVGDNKFPQGSYESIPVFGFEKLTESQEQCLRQWTRAVYSKLYQTTVMGDEIIYLVLGTALIVRNSMVPEEIKMAYLYLCSVMLKKKRNNSMKTEWERLEDGNLPIPNTGKVEDFYIIMSNVARKLNIETKPMRLWHEICDMLGGKVKEKQQPHCKLVPGEWSNDFKTPTYAYDFIPPEFIYNYTCLVTLEDISEIGGYRINPHKSMANRNCAPVYLLSEVGKKQLTENKNCLCPICYIPLRVDQFSQINKKVEFQLRPEYQEKNPFLLPEITIVNKAINRIVTDMKDLKINENNGGTLVALKGVVGCGKSTLALKIKKIVEDRGGICFIEGVDKYCKTGTSIPDAVEKVKLALIQAAANEAKDKVIIIDTCGEQNLDGKSKSYFNIDFSNWKIVPIWPNLDKKNVSGYLAWSLYNVLCRKRPTIADNYWLNPEGAGVHTCKQVHKKKAQALRMGKQWKFDYVTRADDIKDEAERYVIPETPFNI